MRLDRILSEAGAASRSQAARLIRARRVTVDGAVVRDPSAHADPEKAAVAVDGVPVAWQRFRYLLLHKPAGCVSATEDRGPTVMELLPPALARGTFPCGRLDIDTTGLLLITNDGALAHRLLSPRRHVDKTYRFSCEPPIGEEARRALCAGVDIGGGIVTMPASVTLFGEAPSGAGEITVHEGKFHQIKRMFEAVGSRITALSRVRFGPLTLDGTLPPGAWRPLTEDEIAALRQAGGAGSPEEEAEENGEE